MVSPFEWSVMTLWQKGWDTLDIARELKVPEFEVANILLHLRERKGGVDAERGLVGSAQ
jgi:hypothetical protein